MMFSLHVIMSNRANVYDPPPIGIKLDHEPFTALFGDESIGTATAVCRNNVSKATIPKLPDRVPAGYTIPDNRMGNKISWAWIITIITAAEGIVIVVTVAARFTDPDDDVHFGFSNLG